MDLEQTHETYKFVMLGPSKKVDLIHIDIPLAIGGVV
jgi:hypothetical protein